MSIERLDPPPPGISVAGAVSRTRTIQRSSGVTGVIDDAEVPRLRSILARLWYRKYLIMGVTFALTLAIAVVVANLKSSYRAYAEVVVRPQEMSIADLNVAMTRPLDAAQLETEVQRIRSRGLARRVIASLKLLEDPEFNAELRPSNVVSLSSIKAAVRDVLSFWNFSRSRRAGSADTESTRVSAEVKAVDQFLNRLDVDIVGTSNVIKIAFQSLGPEMAAKITNAVASEYVVAQLNAKFDNTRRATEWLEERVSRLRDEIKEADEAAEAFRKEAGLLEGQNAALSSEGISDLNAQLTLAEVELAQATSRLNEMERLYEQDRNALGRVIESELWQKLNEEEAQLATQAAQLAQEYGDRHPAMMAVQSALTDLRAKIGAEIGRVFERARNDVAVGQARAAALKAKLAEQTKEIAAQNAASVKYRTLRQEADVRRTLLDTYLARLSETETKDSYLEPDATIVSEADVPLDPAYPKRTLLMFLGLLFSGTIGLAAAITLELFDSGLRSMDQVERLLGVTPLGLIPRVRGWRQPAQCVLDNPESAYTEALNAATTSLWLSHNFRSIVITSALPKEGKSTFALSLARVLALQGQRICLVDLDLRQPAIHRLANIPLGPGLRDLFTGICDLEQATTSDEAIGLDIIPAGEAPVALPRLLRSEELRQLLRQLERRWDVVLIDTPPLMAVADARLLVSHVDATVLLVRWESTRRERAMTALNQLVGAQANIAGVALTMVDVRKHASYDFGDSGFYSRRVAGYYQS
jgi:succinoglycan biosynthesis transport protein ExoP